MEDALSPGQDVAGVFTTVVTDSQSELGDSCARIRSLPKSHC